MPRVCGHGSLISRTIIDCLSKSTKTKIKVDVKGSSKTNWNENTTDIRDSCLSR